MVEIHDTYQKQSYRNRCDIYGANGKLSLTIPVKHEKGKRLMVKEIRIDYATDWRKLHWKGIESAYNSSPYFEFYRDIFEPYYKKETNFLVDFCMEMNDEILKILNIAKRPELTQVFVFPSENENFKDLRNSIHPKVNAQSDAGFKIIAYPQVFMQSHAYIQNLSILDLVFNLGPESGSYLKSCLV